jgi:hypothetical protein
MIVSFSTENYRQWLCSLLASYKFSNPEGKAMIFCVGWHKEIIQSFEKHYPGYRFIDYPMSKQIAHDVRAGQRSGELLRLKPYLLMKTYEKVRPQPVLWVDADTLILKNIQPLLDVLKSDKYDFMTMYRSAKKSAYERFNVTALGFCLTEAGHTFLKLYNKLTQVSKGYENWFQEQLSLYEAFDQSEVKPRLYMMSDLESSLEGNPDSIIVSRRNTVNIRKIAKDKGINFEFI